MRVRSMRFLGLALTLALAGVATMAVSSASAEVQHFLACKKVPLGTGIYDDSKCTVLGGDQRYIKKTFTSSPEEISASSNTGFELETTLFGFATQINCETQSGTGAAWNPEPYETSNGEASITVTLEGCSVVKPALGCTVAGGEIATNELSGTLGETFGPGVTLAPASGEVFGEIVIQSCLGAGTYAIKGSTFGIADNEQSSLEFTNETSSLTVNGAKAVLRGVSILEDGEGSSLLIEP